MSKYGWMNETKNINNQQINLKGTFAKKGFGFSCLKKAFELKIAGRLEKLSSKEIEINLQGSENKILNFYDWCLTVPETTSGEIINTNKQYPTLNEFKIINSI